MAAVVQIQTSLADASGYQSRYTYLTCALTLPETDRPTLLPNAIQKPVRPNQHSMTVKYRASIEETAIAKFVGRQQLETGLRSNNERSAITVQVVDAAVRQYGR